MMVRSRSWTSSRDQLMRSAFWLCSRPDTATPPALAALAGPNRTPAARKRSVASRLHGMLAPSPTARTPFATRASASPASSSFWVAHGSATSQGTPHGLAPG